MIQRAESWLAASIALVVTTACADRFAEQTRAVTVSGGGDAAEARATGGTGGLIALPEAGPPSNPFAPRALDGGGCADRRVVCDSDSEPPDASAALTAATDQCPNSAPCGGTTVRFADNGCATEFETTVTEPDCIASVLESVRFACVDAATAAYKPAQTFCGGP